jgi:hypothetical protein
MKAAAAPIPFAGSMLIDYRHVCAFFSSLQEEYDTLLPFVRDGLQRGERAYHLLPSQYRREHLEQLRGAGIDVEAAQRRGQLEVATSQETYLRGERFNKDAAIALMQEVLKTGATLGFPLTRLIAHGETVLEDWSRVNDWIEYEARVNDLLQLRPHALCRTIGQRPSKNGVQHAAAALNPGRPSNRRAAVPTRRQ